MYGNGSGFGNNMGGFGVPSLDPDTCSEPALKCPCGKCRAKIEALEKFYGKNLKEAKNESFK